MDNTDICPVNMHLLMTYQNRITLPTLTSESSEYSPITTLTHKCFQHSTQIAQRAMHFQQAGSETERTAPVGLCAAPTAQSA